MVKHIVFFKFEDKSVIESVVEKLSSLKEKIVQIKELEVGVNFAEETRAFDLALTVVVDSKEDLYTYAKHPEHLPVVEYIKSLKAESKVVDYEF